MFLRAPNKSVASPLEANLYSYALNNPNVFTDPSGLLTFVVAYDSRDESFKLGAETRRREIESSEGFDGSADHVYMVGIEKISDLPNRIEGPVSNAEERGYGATVEFSVYSHVWVDDGPQLSGRLSAEQWAEIDFNWDSEQATLAAFYGCRSNEFSPVFLAQLFLWPSTMTWPFCTTALRTLIVIS